MSYIVWMKFRQTYCSTLNSIIPNYSVWSKCNQPTFVFFFSYYFPSSTSTSFHTHFNIRRENCAILFRTWNKRQKLKIKLKFQIHSLYYIFSFILFHHLILVWSPHFFTLCAFTHPNPPQNHFIVFVSGFIFRFNYFLL